MNFNTMNEEIDLSGMPSSLLAEDGNWERYRTDVSKSRLDFISSDNCIVKNRNGCKNDKSRS